MIDHLNCKKTADFSRVSSEVEWKAFYLIQKIQTEVPSPDLVLQNTQKTFQNWKFK